MELKKLCFDWFNQGSRKDFDNITLESIKSDLEDLQRLAPNDKLLEHKAEDILNTMQEIIKEFDEIIKKFDH